MKTSRKRASTRYPQLIYGKQKEAAHRLGGPLLYTFTKVNALQKFEFIYDKAEFPAKVFCRLAAV